MQGAGDSRIRTVYNFVDGAPPRRGYYRLRQVDFDGQSSFSNTILVTNEADAEDLRITASPNPAATENVTLLLRGLKAGALQVAVHDMAGRILVDQRFDNGVASQQIKISDVLPEGVYIVTVKQGYKTAATRLVIVNTGAR